MKYPEFDSYAAGYSGGMEYFLKRLLGGSFTAFMAIKVDWLLIELAANPLNCLEAGKEIHLLDFGCGTAELLQYLKKMKFKGVLEGCEVSGKMLEEALNRWNEPDIPKFYLIKEDGNLPFRQNSYEVIVANCVFHHIDSSKHSKVFNELVRILKPGGRILVFEHNPFNPLTRWIVNRTSIDRNASLIAAGKIKKFMLSAGFKIVKINNFIFFPPRFRGKWLRQAESYLRFVPLGAEYVVVGEKAK